MQTPYPEYDQKQDKAQNQDARGHVNKVCALIDLCYVTYLIC